MPTSFKRLELLEQQFHQAHRSAVGVELERRGLREVNPMILAILKHVEQAGTESFSQRDLARMMDISPAAVTNSLKRESTRQKTCLSSRGTRLPSRHSHNPR